MIYFPGILPWKGVKFFFGVSMKYISTTTKIVDFSIETGKYIEQIVQHPYHAYLTSTFIRKIIEWFLLNGAWYS